MQEGTTTYAARGKVMITGEYLTLLGARTFAWPTQKRHFLHATAMVTKNQLVSWISIDNSGSVWFKAIFSLATPFSIVETTDQNVAMTLLNMLEKACVLGGEKVLLANDWTIETQIEWPNAWGLGSSSSLLANIGSWLRVDPFKLQESTIGGSGYDVACALSDAPLVYEKKERVMAAKVSKSALMMQHCGLAYSGQKASTSQAVSGFLNKYMGTDLSSKIDLINRLTYKVLEASRIEIIIQAFRIHEETIGYLLDHQPIGASQFPDFEGIVKSCGAWGGDFILFTGRQPFSAYREDVKNKYGLELFSLPEMLV